ncbi:hypothetical protein Tco_1329576 [Tanacetum coccineum]
MRTRSQSRNSNRQQQQVNPTFVEPFNLVEPIENQAPPVVTMDDTRTMAQLLEAPTVGYEDAIVVPEITDGHFNLSTVSYPRSKTKQFFGDMTKMTLYAHIPFYNKIASTDESRTIPSTSIKLRLFLFSIDGAGPDLVEKNPLDRFLSWDVLVQNSKQILPSFQSNKSSPQ